MTFVRPFPAAFLLLSAVVIAALGCGDPTKPAATITIPSDTLVAFSINHSLAQQPSAFDLATNLLVVPDGTLAFDIVFDLDPAGRPIIFPAKLIGTVLGSPRIVGIQNMDQSFESITIAEHSGYNFNDPDTVSVGTVFEVVSQNGTACVAVSITSQQALYSKFVIDSVDVPTGRVFFRAVVDPNCDYDTLVPGIIPTH